MPVFALIATIPQRRQSCERLLAELVKQSRPPNAVILVLDGYGDLPAPVCPLRSIEVRSPDFKGAGNRWLSAAICAPEDILVCLDDDIRLCDAPKLIESLETAVESAGGAAAAIGFTFDGKQAPPGAHSRGELVYAAGCGLTVRAKHLEGLQEFADEVQAAGGPNALGLLGDDDALVSAYLWKTGVKIVHAATGNIYAAPNTRVSSQSAAKIAKKERWDMQKLNIKKITGWPWRTNGFSRG